MGGIDSVIPYEHWTCVPPSPPKNLAISSVPATGAGFSFSREIFQLTRGDPLLPSISVDEDKHFETSLAQIGDLDSDDMWGQFSAHIPGKSMVGLKRRFNLLQVRFNSFNPKRLRRFSPRRSLRNAQSP